MDNWPEGWTRGERGRQPRPRTSVMPPVQTDDPYPYRDPYRDYPYDEGGTAPPRRARARRRRRWGRRLLIVALALFLAVVAGYFYLDSRLQRIDVLSDYDGRPADTPGTNWLIVGSDSRAGLSREE